MIIFTLWKIDCESKFLTNCMCLTTIYLFHFCLHNHGVQTSTKKNTFGIDSIFIIRIVFFIDQFAPLQWFVSGSIIYLTASFRSLKLFNKSSPMMNLENKCTTPSDSFSNIDQFRKLKKKFILSF